MNEPTGKVSSEIAVNNQHSAVIVPQEEVSDGMICKYLQSFGLAVNLTEDEQIRFIEIAKAYQLNPFKREIYCVKYNRNEKDENGKVTKVPTLSIVTGYEVYLKRASRVNVLDGWEAKTVGVGDNMVAIVTIYRKDWKHPFVHECNFAEYKQENSFWWKKPKTMIKKVAISQAFRLCFPDEYGGMPYTAEELPDYMTEQNSSEERTQNCYSEKKGSGTSETGECSAESKEQTVLTEEQKEAWRKALFSKDRKKEITELTGKNHAAYKKWLAQYRPVMTPEEYEEFKGLLDKQKAFIDEAAKNEKNEGRMSA